MAASLQVNYMHLKSTSLMLISLRWAYYRLGLISIYLSPENSTSP